MKSDIPPHKPVDMVDGNILNPVPFAEKGKKQTQRIAVVDPVNPHFREKDEIGRKGPGGLAGQIWKEGGEKFVDKLKEAYGQEKTIPLGTTKLCDTEGTLKEHNIGKMLLTPFPLAADEKYQIKGKFNLEAYKVDMVEVYKGLAKAVTEFNDNTPIFRKITDVRLCLGGAGIFNETKKGKLKKKAGRELEDRDYIISPNDIAAAHAEALQAAVTEHPAFGELNLQYYFFGNDKKIYQPAWNTAFTEYNNIPDLGRSYASLIQNLSPSPSPYTPPAADIVLPPKNPLSELLHPFRPALEESNTGSLQFMKLLNPNRAIVTSVQHDLKTLLNLEGTIEIERSDQNGNYLIQFTLHSDVEKFIDKTLRNSNFDITRQQVPAARHMEVEMTRALFQHMSKFNEERLDQFDKALDAQTKGAHK